MCNKTPQMVMCTLGKLLYLMGASGAGKDSLLSAVRPLVFSTPAPIMAESSFCSALCPPLRPVHIIQRHITRPVSDPCSLQAGGENHYACTESSFVHALAEGAYAMHWQSHGLHYGIPKELDTHLARGSLVLVNGSRAYLPEAQRLYPKLIPVLVTVRTEVLRARLEARGRESVEAIDARLRRADMNVKPEKHWHVIDNSEALDSTLDAFVSLVESLRTS